MPKICLKQYSVSFITPELLKMAALKTNCLFPKLHASWISLKTQSLQILNNATIVIQERSPAGFD